MSIRIDESKTTSCIICQCRKYRKITVTLKIEIKLHLCKKHIIFELSLGMTFVIGAAKALKTLKLTMFHQRNPILQTYNANSAAYNVKYFLQC